MIRRQSGSVLDPRNVLVRRLGNYLDGGPQYDSSGNLILKHPGLITRECCCEYPFDECVEWLSGFDEGLISRWYADARLVEMCIRTAVKGWEYIWSPFTFFTAFLAGPSGNVEDAEVDGICFDEKIFPEPVTFPTFGEPVTNLPPAIRFSMSPSNIQSVPEEPRFPYSSIGEYEAYSEDKKCWDLRDHHGTGYIEQAENIDYFVGTLEISKGTSCDKISKETYLGVSKQVKQQLIENFINDNPMSWVGRVVTSGDKIGWYENPRHIKVAIFSIHTRAYLAGYYDDGTPRDPPAWPDGYYVNQYHDSGIPKFYISNAQNIEWKVRIRVSQIPY